MSPFPRDFLWGAATAGHQVEGGNVNADLWPMEWATNSTFNEPSGDACDHYHRYPEDIAMLAELGLNAYRFSLEWSRIEPEPGFYSVAALDHYARMMESCLDHGVTPVVTYNHFTVPRWMAGRGGWRAEDAPGRFADYAARATKHFGDLLTWVCTLNEPNLMAMMRSTGVLAMGTGDRPPATRPLEEGSGGIGGYDPARVSDGDRGGRPRTDGPGTPIGRAGRQVDERRCQGGLDPCPCRPPGRRGRRRAVVRGTSTGADRLARGLGRRRLRGCTDVFSVSRRIRWPAPCAERGSHHADRVGGVPRSARSYGPPRLRTCGGARPGDRERYGHSMTMRRGLRTPGPRWRDSRAQWRTGSMCAATSTGLFSTISSGTPASPRHSASIAVDRQTFVRTVKPSARWLGQVARRNALG